MRRLGEDHLGRVTDQTVVVDRLRALAARISATSKAALRQAVTEAKVTAGAGFDTVKKAEAAQLTAKALAGSGWLPEPLQTAAA